MSKFSQEAYELICQELESTINSTDNEELKQQLTEALQEVDAIGVY